MSYGLPSLEDGNAPALDALAIRCPRLRLGVLKRTVEAKTGRRMSPNGGRAVPLHHDQRFIWFHLRVIVPLMLLVVLDKVVLPYPIRIVYLHHNNQRENSVKTALKRR
jgi:hypothetical protein